MWPYIVAGVVAGGALIYKWAEGASAPPPVPAPIPRVNPLQNVVFQPSAPVAPAPSQGTAQPHKVPGGTYVYTGAQASPADVQATANALAAVDPTVKSSEQLVRNFQDAAGLAQRPGGPGWDQVQPTGTDGRYGHDVAAILAQYVPNAPPASATRPTWWGPTSTYHNP